MDEKLFRNPPGEYGIKPFWFWNGEMNETEIVHQIKEMSEKGIGGVFICARQGLKIPYLSEQWFERVKFATKTAAQYGLEVWLYDEYPYPSGMGGGEVTLSHPQAKQNSLIQRFEAVRGCKDFEMELPWAKVISALAAPKDSQSGRYQWHRVVDLRKYIGNYQAETVFQKTGLTKYNYKRYFTYGPQKRLVWQVPEGEFGIFIAMAQEIADFKYYGTYVDPCDEEAVATFIQTTHERYHETLGDFFGQEIKGIFSDEVGLLGKIPWSTRLRSFFKKRNGYDIYESMPALFDEDYDHAAKIRYDFYQSLHLLFRSTYHEKISRWCDEHRIQYATEVPSVRMATQQFSHIPGGDSAHEKLGRTLEWILDEYTGNLRANPKMVSSLARQLGRRFAMIECFHSIGWSMNLQDAKWMIDRLAAFGINFYNFHAFYYTTDGLTKHDAPPSQFLQNPYWKHFKHLSDYVRRLAYLISESTAATDIAVLDPTPSFWTHLGNPFHGFDYGGHSEIEKKQLDSLKKDWIYVCKTLLMNQVDYDHIDGEILAEAEVREGKLVKGKAIYGVVILPPLSNMEASVWEKLKAFLHAGGKVIALGMLPYEVIDDNTNIQNEMRAWFGVSASDPTAPYVKGDTEAYFISTVGSLTDCDRGGEWLKLLTQLSENKFSIRFLNGNRRAFLMHPRQMADGTDIVFISNQEGEAAELILSVQGESDRGSIVELDLETGAILPLNFEKRAGGYEINLPFRPYEARLVQVKANQGKGQERPKALTVEAEHHGIWLDPSARWELAVARDNILRLAHLEFNLDEGDQGLTQGWHRFAEGHHWMTVEPKTLIDQCSDGYPGQSYPVVFHQDFGIPMKLKLSYPMIVWYRTQFKVDYLPEVAKLLMDGGAISGDYCTYINGVPLSQADFSPEFHHDHQNQTCDIRPWLQKGINHLAVRVVAEQDWNGVVDPLYIVGSFGVTFDSEGTPVLGLAPKTAQIQGPWIKGYPYYAGEFSFKQRLNITPLPEEEEILMAFHGLDPNFHDPIELLLNGRSLGVRPWSPYLWRIKRDLIRAGKNEIEVKIVNTLIGMFDGKYFDYGKHQLVEIRYRR